MPDEMLRRGPSKSTNSRADAIPWSDEATRQLLILLNNFQDQYGNNGNGFKLSVWTQVSNLLKEKGYLRTAKQAQNKFTMIKARWKDREYLKNLSGFGIDPTTKRITAADQCWEDLKKVSIVAAIEAGYFGSLTCIYRNIPRRTIRGIAIIRSRMSSSATACLIGLV